ncbi:MAG TPA: hypothetical protein VGL13_12390, partial [Polyangiaceae bacterium]
GGAGGGVGTGGAVGTGGGIGGSTGVGGLTGTGGSTGLGGFNFDAGFDLDAFISNLDGGTCADLVVCCTKLTGQLQTACNSAVTGANGSNPICNIALAAFKQQGFCL